MAATMSLCAYRHLPWTGTGPFNPRIRHHLVHQHSGRLSYGMIVLATTEGSAKSSKSEEQIPSWAKPDSSEPPPWARNEGSRSTTPSAFEIPFYAYLLTSAVTAIAGWFDI